jgi:FkbM family methyltransferase
LEPRGKTTGELSTDVWRKIKDPLKQLARRAGYDIVPFDRTGGSLANHLARLFELLGINCVLDVGAHEGWYGQMLGEIGYRGYIVSFEPVRENFDLLTRRSAENPRWSAHRLALGSVDKKATINVARRSDFSSLFATSTYGREQFAGMSETARVEEVRVARLDTVIDEVTSHVPAPRIFLKMDTQGNDIDVFRGAKRCLDRIAALQAELYFREVYEGAPLFDVALAELRAGGFELTDIYPVGRAEHLEVIDADCVMVRREH